MAHVLVIGANRGIGLELARQLAARGDSVVGTARDPDDATALAEVATVLPCDVTDDASVAALVAAWGDRPLDLLLHVAGILIPGGLEGTDLDDVSAQLETNAVGPLWVVRAFVPRLRATADAKVALLTSRMGSIGDNTSGGAYGYRASKAALNAIGKSLAHDLAPIPVLLLHPGYVATDMTGNQGDVGPDKAAADLITVIDDARSDASGRFWHREGYELPW